MFDSFSLFSSSWGTLSPYFWLDSVSLSKTSNFIERNLFEVNFQYFLQNPEEVFHTRNSVSTLLHLIFRCLIQSPISQLIINDQKKLFILQQNQLMIGPSKNFYVESDSQQENPNDPNQNSIKSTANQYQQVQDQVSKSFYEMGIPVQSFATLQGHSKTVACVAVDPKGIRMATGGLDYHVRLWDFHGMNKTMNSFRIIQPFAGNVIRCLNFNPAGTHLMVINGGKQITFLDKDGARSLLTVKGYMYVKQLHNTKGHTNTIYDGKFHPINSNQFASCSGDGSIRLWDMEQKLQGIQQQLAHKKLLKCKDAKGLSTGITAISYIEDGSMIYGGCLDGSLQGFSTKHNLHRPQILVRNAHKNLQQFSSILSLQNGRKIVTRNGDGTLKVWDTRNIEKPYVHYSNLSNRFPGSKMCLSPNGQFLLAGTSINPESLQKEGYLHFFDTTSFNKLKTINVGQASVTDVVWSRAINQIVIGTSKNEAKIYFDRSLSIKGALQAIVKEPRIDKDPKFDYSHPIYLPHSLPIYKERPTNNNKKDKEELRKNPILTMKPFIPAQGPNKDGKKNVAFTQIQHIIQSLNANPQVVQDARMPLWQIGKHVDRSKQFTAAYRDTQPEQIYNSAPTEQKQFEFLSNIKKICPHCGLKLCTCARRHIYDYEEDLEQQQQNNKNK